MAMAFQVTAIITSLNVPLHSGTFNSDWHVVTRWSSRTLRKGHPSSGDRDEIR
jgi:hypothetical protein